MINQSIGDGKLIIIIAIVIITRCSARKIGGDCHLKSFIYPNENRKTKHCFAQYVDAIYTLIKGSGLVEKQINKQINNLVNKWGIDYTLRRKCKQINKRLIGRHDGI